MFPSGSTARKEYKELPVLSVDTTSVIKVIEYTDTGSAEIIMNIEAMITTNTSFEIFFSDIFLF